MYFNIQCLFLISLLFPFSHSEENSTINLNKVYFDFANDILSSIITDPDNLTEEQIEYISNYLSNPAHLSYSIENSSHKLNELHQGKLCNENFTFVVILSENNSSLLPLNSTATIGMCLKKITDKDLQGIIDLITIKTKNFLNLYNDYEIIQSISNTPISACTAVLYLIPLFIVTVLALFSIFNCIPTFLFGKCFKYKPGLKQSDLSSSKIRENETSRKNLFNFIASFNLFENTDEVFNSDLITRINNDNGLAYSKGLRGISMMITIFGYCFVKLVQFPMKIYEENNYFKTVSSLFFPFYTFGARIAPKVLFSVSGFVFIFKFISFLDEEVERKKEIEEIRKMRQYKLEKLNPVNSTSVPNEAGEVDKIEDLLQNDLVVEKDEKNQRVVGCDSLCKFFLYQSHKVLIILSSVVIYRYSVPAVIQLINRSVPPGMNILLTKYINSITPIDFLGYFLLYQNFYFPQLKTPSGNSLLIFWPLLNEIFFFVLTTPIVLISYKRRWNFPLLVIALSVILIIAKYVIYIQFKSDEDYATCYFKENSFIGLLMLNPIYNYVYYLIGIFFGTMNYCIQKGIKEAYTGYLRLATSIIYFLKYQTKFLLYFFVILEAIVILIIVELNPLYIHFTQVKTNEDFLKNSNVNYFYIIDAEIVVFLLHLMLVSLYLKGGNSLTQFLSHGSWSIANKFYFTFTISLNLIIMWIFYQSETRICLEMFSYFVYGIIAIFYLTFTVLLNLIFVEFPLKKIIVFLKEQGRKSKNLSIAQLIAK